MRYMYHVEDAKNLIKVLICKVSIKMVYVTLLNGISACNLQAEIVRHSTTMKYVRWLKVS